MSNLTLVPSLLSLLAIAAGAPVLDVMIQADAVINNAFPNKTHSL